ncbi:MAG: type II toxin-antitoxin system VapC family toxin, partial [Treponema sp.]|nr:type II toxin-antitoxin system VapC family toxin [Treponema sp.]
LDTCTVLWYLNGDSRLSVKVRDLIEDTANRILVSLASVWEVAIKVSVEKLKFPNGAAGFVEQIKEKALTLLPIKEEYILKVEKLPFHHRDPFDRLIVASAQVEKITLLSDDTEIKKYKVARKW